MRTRKVGSITCGVLLIIFGMLFLVHMVYPSLSLTVIMKLWPVVLIALGVEMLVANYRCSSEESEVLKYDKGAIGITFLLVCFSMVMGVMEYWMEYYTSYAQIYMN